jgi:hypothetical protein
MAGPAHDIGEDERQKRFEQPAADAIQHHSALSRGVELRAAVIGRAGFQNIFPNPKNFIHGVERVDLEFQPAVADYVNLVKVDGTWRIVNKVYYRKRSAFH